MNLSALSPPAFAQASAGKPATAIAAAAILACLLLGASPVQAQPACGDWKQITDHLEKEYGEVPVGMGVDDSGLRMLEVYASPAGTWTVIVTMAGGPSCLMATGNGWQTIVPTPRPAPEQPL